MSIKTLSSFRNIPKNSFFGCIILTRVFSRRSIDVEEPYKVVKGREVRKEKGNWKWKNPNFEFLASNNYPFFMNGNVGPAWYDKHTTLDLDSSCKFIMEEVPAAATATKVTEQPGIMCQVQTCPKLLRQTVMDLFPYRDFETSELTVITITLRPDLHLLRRQADIETEKLAQTFVLTAKSICSKIRKGGFWADFINPFSGRPYFATTKGNDLYETDERFRCLDFQIFEVEKCLVISNENLDSSSASRRSFVGSLFTTAPAERADLTNIFLRSNKSK